MCDSAQEIRAERQRKALEAQQAEQRRIEEERFNIIFVCFMSIFIAHQHTDARY